MRPISKIIAFVGFVLCLSVSFLPSAYGDTLDTEQSTRIELQTVLNNQIGVQELTGNNDGPQVKAYLNSVGLSEGYPWCAAFVNYNLQKVDVCTTANSAWSPSWFPISKTIYTRNSKHNRTPQVGDVFGVYFTSKQRIAHVGFIDSWPENSKFFVTIEGNTNDDLSREGNGVYRKRRPKTHAYKIADWITNNTCSEVRL